jgi:DNA-binding MarR family transcriptional regulator
MMAVMGAGLPLPTLLSHTLVAFTIEFDNEAERQMRHRTTRHGASAGSWPAPWLVSMVMWSNCMRFVGKEGVPVCELERLARTKTNLPGMERWGYVAVGPDPADRRPKQPRSAWLVRATASGIEAQKVWQPLFAEIERRWQERFGKDAVEQVRESLQAVAGQFGVELPECLPILGYGLFSRGPEESPLSERNKADGFSPLLPALLSKVLLAFAIDFEHQSDLSLAICANVLRVVDEKGVPVKDLPMLGGVSKEAIGVAMGFLLKRKIIVVEADPSATRLKIVRLTPRGREAQEASRKLLSSIEERWRKRFGAGTIQRLRESLESLVGDAKAQTSPLFRGLEPPPDGWRASVVKPMTLPHYPMVLHRGGFPDGS